MRWVRNPLESGVLGGSDAATHAYARKSSSVCTPKLVPAAIFKYRGLLCCSLGLFMLDHMVAIILWVTFSLGQLVFSRPPGPDYCYRVEKIQPNLELNRQLRVGGTITDQLRNPFKNSRVELRKYISQRKQTTVKVATTDASGHFDLETVKPGRYRLLPSPSRVFKQPSPLECNDSDTCKLRIMLMINATDQPDSICPIR
jgi:hypothetical protein